MLISIELNNFIYSVKRDIPIIEACKYIGVSIPRFCYHEKLSIAASCRMCIVEIEKIPKPVTACSTDVASNIIIYTNTPFVQKARENIIEALLLNHPLDCPICDQAGECDLQDQVKLFGNSQSRFFGNKKRGVEDKFCGPLIKTIMTRCIHCTRCIRFGSEIAGINYLGTLNRGISSEIGGYVSKLFNSEISGNVIDLCPVGKITDLDISKKGKGALTANAHSFKTRPWEVRTIESIDTTDSLGANIYVNYKEKEIVRILPKTNEILNEQWITDKTRFSFDSNISNRLHTPMCTLLQNSNLEDRVQKLNVNSNPIDFITDCLHFLPSESSNLFFCGWNHSCFSFYLNFLNFKIKKNSSQKFFLINEKIDLELLTSIRIFTKINKNINIYLINNKKRKNNLHIFWSNDKITLLNSEITNCFLFVTNIKIENAILNIKLHVKSTLNNLNVFSFGLVSANTYALNCINLNFKTITIFFEGKQFETSINLVSKKNPLFFFGNAFKTRLSLGCNVIFTFFKLNFPSTVCLNLHAAANTSSSEMYGLTTINKNKFLKSKAIFFYNLDVNLKLNKIFFSEFFSNKKNQLKKYFWFNSYYQLYLSKFGREQFFLPTLNSIEFKGIFLNLEERPQQTQSLKIDKFPLLNRILKHFLTKFFFIPKYENVIKISSSLEFLQLNYIQNINNKLELNFLFELLEFDNLFTETKKNFSLTLSKHLILKNYFQYFKYPFKSTLDDFYVNDIYTENSITMIKCSREIRKTLNNF